MGPCARGTFGPFCGDRQGTPCRKGMRSRGGDGDGPVILGAPGCGQPGTHHMLGRPEAPHAAGQWRPVDPPVVRRSTQGIRDSDRPRLAPGTAVLPIQEEAQRPDREVQGNFVTKE